MKKHPSERCVEPVTEWTLLQDELPVDSLESLPQRFQGDVSESITPNTNGPTKRTPLPASNLAYKEKDYWDRRFETEEDYDWLMSYKGMAAQVREAIPREARVLVVGCGNSTLSADMYDDGYRNILSTDFSAVVIDKMRRKHGSSRPGLQWEQMDMLALDLKDESINAVVDKAAMDALLVEKRDPWNPDAATVEQSHRMCSEISRVLTPGGVFMQLSFELEHFRRKLLLGEHVVASSTGAMGGHRTTPVQARSGCGSSDDVASSGESPDYGWDLTVHGVQREGGCFGYSLYLMRKRRREEVAGNA